ncbi:MAG: ATP-binding protein [Acidobacteria bacterium]|nr:ATP-binding protein [Acidobacteriota bacterium]
MPKRIIPIASGKGGVGKTTFAVHFALELSRRAPTVLVDLDTATSSLRNTLRVPITHDLYHFHRKGHRLAECVTQLDGALDRRGRFRDFGFVAGPIHYLEDLAAMGPELRRRLASEIASLPADYVVLDLRAGVDATVLEFLPYTNSGVLIFTPQLPQAAAAAADLVKAVVFRTLRVVFGARSGVFELPGIAAGRELIGDLLGRAEDAYDSSVPSLDYLLRDLRDVYGDHPLVSALGELLTDFRVHYVLNQFDGVEASHERAVVPFVRTLSDGVSARLELTQLGWLAQDAALHRANCQGRPVLLDDEAPRARTAAGDPLLAELQALRSAALGLDRRPSERIARQRTLAVAKDPVDALLGEQLDRLRTIFAGGGGGGVRENLSYCVARALALMQPPRLPTEFGMTQLAPPEQLVRWLLRRMPVAAAAGSEAAGPVR